MKIHLLALMATDLDADILQHWIDHYTVLDIDTYNIFLHEEQSHDYKLHAERLRDYAFNVQVVSYPGHAYTGKDKMAHCEKLRAIVMQGFSMTTPLHEYLLTVDSDEFQQWPEDGIKETMLDGAIHTVEGHLVDCYDSTLKPAVPDVPLAVQYPMTCRHIETMLIPNDSKIAKMKQNKICCHRNDIRISFGGSHTIMSVPHNIKGCFRTRGEIKVFHYKWRASTKERLLTKQWYDKDKADMILNAFNESEVVHGQV